jgi:hypothetical protein
MYYERRYYPDNSVMASVVFCVSLEMCFYIYLKYRTVIYHVM